MNKIRKGDTVIVVTGKYKGTKSNVLRIFPSTNSALVSGVNLALRHKKQSKNTSSPTSLESPIDLSNLSIVDPSDGNPTRVGFVIKDGKKFRYSKRSGELLDE